MRKFLLSMALVFCTAGAMAQLYQQTETMYTAAELNAMTEETYIAVKNVSGTNSYYLAGNANVASFSNDVVLVWEPAEEGVTGKYHLRRLSAGETGYIQAATGTNVTITLGAKATAQAFEAVETSALTEDGFNSAGALVRFKQYGTSTWLNCNAAGGAPRLGNTGLGGWTMHNVFAVEEVPAVSVTYEYQLNGVTKKTVTVEQAVGSAYALPVDLPYVAETFTEGTVAEAATVVVTCELQTIPFVAAASFGEIEHWYYMQIRDDGFTYLQYDSSKEYIPASLSSEPTSAKKTYAWGFVGDPFNGFEIVNYAAGETMVLSAPSTPTGDKNAAELARMVTKEGAAGNTAWMITPATHSNAVENTFYVQHPTATAYAFNRQNYDGAATLCYWSNRDTGSALRAVECEISTLAEDLVALVAQAEAQLGQIAIGEGVGEYSSSYENYETVYTEIVTYSQNIPDTATDEEIQNKIDTLNAIIASFSLNMPVAGKYYRLKGAQSGYYATSNMCTNANYTTKLAMEQDGTTAASIWYLSENNAFLSYVKGQYLGNFAKEGGTWSFEAIGSTGNSVVFAEGGTVGKYQIKPSSGRALYGDDIRLDAADESNNSGHYNWTIEEVTALPVTITTAGMATLFAPVALEVPAEVTAYTVTISGDWAVLNEVEGDVIPANTGVVLEGAEGTYNFAITTTDETATSALAGTVASEYKTVDAYVLGVKDDEVGFYTATTDGQAEGTFLNNGHKAYLPKTAGMNAASYSFRFGEGTTGISEMKGESGNVKGIYDLTGRRVEAITAPGIYIVGGKKVLVK